MGLVSLPGFLMKRKRNFEKELSVIARSIPSKEALTRMEQERIARQGRPIPVEKLLQNTTLLSAWLERCKKAGIKAVPAIFSPDVAVSDIFDGIDGMGECLTVGKAIEWLKHHYTPGTMWRWEQCAPMELKSVMAHGGSAAERIRLTVDDPRLFDILFENNVATTRLAVRPIVDIKRYGKYPIEFRCYVFGPDQVAVSNYYPQRGLPNSYRSWAVKAGELALRLYSFVGTNYTADFCLTEDKDIVFLEGGPPWGAGSHPCCFAPDAVEPGRIVLAPEKGALEEG